MALKPILQFRNADRTLDLNTTQARIVDRAIFDGGELTPSAVSLQVSIAPFIAAGYDGMVAVSDAIETRSIPAPAAAGPDRVSYLVLHLEYRSLTTPIVTLQVIPESTWTSSVSRNFFITFAKFAVPFGATALTDAGVEITYSDGDWADKLGKTGWRSPVDTLASLPLVGNRAGDTRCVLDTMRLYQWDGTLLAWAAINTELVLDDSNFFGDDALVENGGLAKPWTGSQAGFDDLNEKIAQRRTVTFTVTDGTASTGGNFNGSAALSTAVTALGGTGGVLYLRRGTYTVADTYTIPSNVQLVGEGRSLVTITQAAGSSLTFSSGSQMSGLTVNSSAGLIVLNGSVCTDVLFTGPVEVGASSHFNKCSFTDLTTIIASSNSFENVTFNRLWLLGDYSRFTNVSLIGTTVSADSIARVVGSYNTFANVSFRNLGAIPSGASVLEVTGLSNSFENGVVFTSGGGGAVNTRPAYIAGEHNYFEGITFTAEAEVALLCTGTSSGTFKNCVISNTDAFTIYPTVQFTSSTNATRWVFEGCVFDQLENPNHALLSFGSIITSDQVYRFVGCVFKGSRLTGQVFIARSSTFDTCEFVIKNPQVTGVHRLGGDEDGQTATLFEFRSSILSNCLINGMDAEVNNSTGSGDPDFVAPLFATFYDTKVDGLRLFNVNRHIRDLNSNAGLLELDYATEMTNLRVEFTSTAAVQGGSESLGCLMSLNGSVSQIRIEDVYFDATTAPNASVSSVFAIRSNGSRLHISDIVVDGVCDTPVLYDPGVNLTWSTFENWRFTNTTTAFGLPTGGDSTFKNIYVTTSDAFGLLNVMGVSSNYVIEGCTFTASVAQSVVSPMIRNFAGVPIALTRVRWVGNQFNSNGPAGTKDFAAADITFSGCVGAGNIWIYTGGTAGTPSFSASVNTW